MQIFTVEQANRLIPSVKAILAKLRRQRSQVHELEDALAIVELEGLQADGSPSPLAKTVALEKSSRIEKQMDEFKTLLEELDALGCQLKNLDEGLVDFFTIHQGQLVYLCWKDGEEAIAHWHRMEDGFAGRRPIATLANN
ncbi:MAG: DUF2203 domain-containing protein [Candidatus Omnitrophica bacterium]|nr:DUF2203 domain-containing protein [Candidatus Omnitrophota bacterium]